jgi:hypothetical protein
VFGNAPENFIPIISQNRYNTLGGLASQPITIRNLIAIWLKKATTTNPDLITVEASNFSDSFSFASAQYFSDLIFNVESDSLSSIMLPILNTDIADAVNDTVNIKFSGGSGNLDYITISAYFNPLRRDISVNEVRKYRQNRYNKIALVTPRVPPGVGFSAEELQETSVTLR